MESNNNNEQTGIEKAGIENEEYYDRSGCRPIMITLLIIILFWVVVGIKMFT